MTTNQQKPVPAFTMSNEKWQEKKIKLKKKFPDLSEYDLRYEEGKVEEMLERLQRKLRKSKEGLQNFLKAI
ncbi:MAG: general stress protein CsbD [bacterium]